MNPAYLFAFYFLQACAVIIMAPVGFAFVTKWAPMEWTGRLTGVWISATGLGSFLGGYAKNAIDNVLIPLNLYEVFFLVMFCAAIGLLAMNRLIIKMIGDWRRWNGGTISQNLGVNLGNVGSRLRVQPSHGVRSYDLKLPTKRGYTSWFGFFAHLELCSSSSRLALL